MQEIKTEITSSISTRLYEKVKIFENFNFYCSAEWHELLKETFKWDISHITGFLGDEIKFYLPYISKSRIPFGSVNLCLPLSHKVGIAYSSDSKDTQELFIKSFLDKINNIEIHDHVDFNSSKLVSSNYISVLDLTRYNSTEDIYKTLDYSSVKYMVNRAKKNIVINSDYTKENFDAFYMMETDVRLRQGSPMYPQDFFSNMCEIFNNTGMIDIKIAMLNDKPVAGAIFFNFAHTKTYAYSASINDKEIKKYGANEYLLWSAIADASGAGFKCFDFGTTPDHLIGLLKYKEKWNATSTKLDYSFIGYDKIKTVNRNSPSVKLISFIISKTPKVIFRKLSPYLLKAAV